MVVCERVRFPAFKVSKHFLKMYLSTWINIYVSKEAMTFNTYMVYVFKVVLIVSYKNINEYIDI